MKPTSVAGLTLVAAIAAAVTNIGMAQPDRHDRHDGGPPGMEHRDERGPDRGGRDMERRDERGAGPFHDVHRGDRLPPQWRNRQYHVEHWRDHGLPPPPPHQVWVQMGPDYALVAQNTGVVVQVVIGR